MKPKKKIVYFDMDNVLVDFQSGLKLVSDETKKKYEKDAEGKTHFDDIPHIFSKMVPMDGAVDAVRKISEKFDCYILSTSPWDNPTALQDKLDWIKKYFGEGKNNLFYKKIIFSHHKNLNHGDFLIDDRKDNGKEKFDGEFLHFGVDEKCQDWKSTVEYLLARAE